jgi:hypothetical protein
LQSSSYFLLFLGLPLLESLEQVVEVEVLGLYPLRLFQLVLELDPLMMSHLQDQSLTVYQHHLRSPMPVKIYTAAWKLIRHHLLRRQQQSQEPSLLQSTPQLSAMLLIPPQVLQFSELLQ